MLTPADLRGLQATLGDTGVLSVYLETGVRDPALRDAWRATLQNAIRDARSRLDDEEERAEFDRAADFLRHPDPSPHGVWGSPGWVAFATGESLHYAGDLPVGAGTRVTWRTGPAIAPYLRALKQFRPVIVAMVESGAVRLFRYALDELEPVGEIEGDGNDAERPGRPTAPSVAGGSAPAARGATGSDVRERRRQAAFARLMSSAKDRLEELDAGEGWILIGGTPEWARAAGEALEPSFTGRVLVSTSLAHDSEDTEIAAAARKAATKLRSLHDSALVDELIDRAGGHSRAAVGVPAIQRAFLAGAVDLLLMTPGFIAHQVERAENFVRAALDAGTDVEIPSGDAADRLDRTAEGVAARLRFAIE